MRRAISGCGVTSISSSAKSMPASSKAISSTSACLTGARAGSAPRPSAGCLAGLGEGLRFNQIAHSLGLGEVEASSQKGTLRELPRFGEARAQLRARDAAAAPALPENRARRFPPHFSRGVGVGRGEECHQGLVNARRAGLASSFSEPSNTSARRARACSMGWRR